MKLIEQIPGKVSGQPIVRGTRILPNGVVNSFALGGTLQDIQEDWPFRSLSWIKRLIQSAVPHRKQPNL